jgi:hypothetical protein
LTNANNRAKLNPVNIAPRKARSDRVIWRVYGFNLK